MNATVLDVLLYLFENCLQDEEPPPRAALERELRSSGFPLARVHQALDWLEALVEDVPAPAGRTDALRVFSDFECDRLSAEARGFLMHLERCGILEPEQREIVIAHLLELDEEPAGIEETKWVTLITLFHQHGQEAAFSRMQDLLHADFATATH
ncbi:MAG TPA: DUF494 domain-containing protein [Gammaproteobacteria bacterium]|nr:DUF494 domain-containing protein [Gammaproteobacteria bacterium]